jgi:pre-rRNA-processing protein TSR3
VVSEEPIEGDGVDGEETIDELDTREHKHVMEIKVKLWEFGQNDPRKDSGSRLTRFGYASNMRVGQVYNGIVLSAESKIFTSAADAELARSHGLAGINCSWNRLDEVPVGALGRDRNQRTLPYLLAANSINYGRPFKLNTAEALAAALYIMGFQCDAEEMMSSFNYGPEFFRMNSDNLITYAACTSSKEVDSMHGWLYYAVDLKHCCCCL